MIQGIQCNDQTEQQNKLTGIVKIGGLGGGGGGNRGVFYYFPKQIDTTMPT